MITTAPTELTKTLQAYEEAAVRNDIDAISTFLDESFVQTYPTGKVANKQEHLAALRSMNAKVESVKRTDSRLLCYPGFAVLLIGTRLVLYLNGKTQSMDVRATQVWRNISPGWSCGYPFWLY
jgi:hypothetical protein